MKHALLSALALAQLRPAHRAFVARAGFVVAWALACMWFVTSAHAAQSPTAFILEQAAARTAPATKQAGAGAPRARTRLEEIAPLAAPVSEVLSEAGRYLYAGNPTGFRGPWCKAFTNFVLRRLGFHPGPSLLAIDGVRDGVRVAHPRPGDLAVMPHHVTFFAGWDDAGGFIGLGGNQHHNVTRAHFNARSVVAWVEPK